MVLRHKFRRLLFLATLVFCSICLLQVLVLPSLRYVIVREPTLDSADIAVSVREPTLDSANIAIPKVDIKHVNLAELLFKNTDRNGELINQEDRDVALEVLTGQPTKVKKAIKPYVTQLRGTSKSKGRYWFFKNGTVWPTKDFKGPIWPQEDPNNDRIVEQLMHIPDNYDPNNIKTILLTNNLAAWNVPMGGDVFQECPVKACKLSDYMNNMVTADAVLFRDRIGAKTKEKRDQIWILYILESPSNTFVSDVKKNDTCLLDWTATYRSDSEIVAPYEKWVYFDPNVKTLEENKKTNFAAGKTHQVAWFVSNCHTANSRLSYAKELQKFISVEIYGACGSHSCPRGSSHCRHLLNTKYKFYLSFENSNCRDYITEKFFVSGLGNNVLPIVMGATKDQYLRSAPEHSFIHVDDFESPKHLAEYLKILDKNDTLYNEYFQWKGTGEMINTHFWCRLCTMLHNAGSGISGRYSNAEVWWHNGTCSNERWRTNKTENLKKEDR